RAGVGHAHQPRRRRQRRRPRRPFLVSAPARRLRRLRPNGAIIDRMMLLTAPLLRGVRHGFSTRRGGVSTGRFATLNLGGKWGDDPDHVAHNRRRLAAAGGFDLTRLYTAKQVHGARVALVVASTLTERVAET